jgi:TPR repeat protein
VARDPDSAERLLLEAAEQDYAPAQTNLGYLYAEEAFSKVDYEKAARWSAAAAEQGDARAALNLATLYSLGKGVPQDPAAAVVWYSAAARSGDEAMREEALRRLAVMPERDAAEAAQELLAELGYDPGPADGVLGPRSRDALAAFQQDRGLPMTGENSVAVMTALAVASSAKKMAAGQ